MVTSLEGKALRAIVRAGVTTVSAVVARGGWVVTYLDTATQADRDTVAAILAAFTEADPTVIADAQAFDADGIDTDVLIQAVAQLDFEERQKLTVRSGQTLLTAPQCRARAKAIYRSLL